MVDATSSTTPPLVTNGDSASLPRSPSVVRVRKLIPGGGRLDWSVQGDSIVYDRRGGDGFYDLYLTDPDGASERCLTCPLLEFRSAHAYAPAWHPSGDWIAFLAQPRASRLDLDTVRMASPDRGLHAELWVISRDGKGFFQLGPGRERGTAVLDAHFSHEGGHLAWSERASSSQGAWSDWVVRVAEFRNRSVPRLVDVETHEPPRRTFLQVLDFSSDDRALLVAGGLDGQSAAFVDLYLMPLAGDRPQSRQSQARQPQALTRATGEANTAARISPRGDVIAWASTRNQRRVGGAATRGLPLQPRDLWLRALDTSAAAGTHFASAERLTYFNDPAAPEAVGGAAVADVAWSPDGRVLAVQVVSQLRRGGQEAIYLVELAPELGR